MSAGRTGSVASGMAHEPTTPFSFGHDPDVPAPPPAPLFSPEQIAAATFFATPVAGALLIAWNLRRLQRRGAIVALAAGVGVIALVLWLDAAWSGAVWWLAVPAWTMLAGVTATALFEQMVRQVGRRSPAVALVVALATIVALAGAGAVATRLAPRAVPSFAELLFAWIGVGKSRVPWDHGATREDALRVGDAIDSAGLVRDDVRLALGVARDQGRLVLRIRLPSASPEAVAAARALTRAVAHNLEPSECVIGRIVNPSGHTLAEGTSCP